MPVLGATMATCPTTKPACCHNSMLFEQDGQCVQMLLTNEQAVSMNRDASETDSELHVL